MFNSCSYSSGFSPDAYIQLAMQLAWYHTMGEFTATYETALTRMFHKGRTKTIRTLSEESRAFVLAMADCSTSVRPVLRVLVVSDFSLTVTRSLC